MKMSFEMALANLKQGKMMRRASWRGTAYRIKTGFLTVWNLVRDSGGAERWEYIGFDGCLFVADVLANDWEVCDEL